MNLQGVVLPSGLEPLTFDECFNQSSRGVALPSRLQPLTFGECFNQSLQGGALPCSLRRLLCRVSRFRVLLPAGRRVCSDRGLFCFGQWFLALSCGTTACGRWPLATSSTAAGKCRAAKQHADLGVTLDVCHNVVRPSGMAFCGEFHPSAVTWGDANHKGYSSAAQGRLRMCSTS